MFMKYSLFLLGALASSVLAAPAADPLEPRACQTATPVAARVYQAQPVESYLPGFVISQNPGATNKNDMFVEFTIPAGSYGCSLETYFPAGYTIQSQGQTQVYVYSTDKNLSFTPRGSDVSWNNSPAPKSHVGTVTFQSDPTKPVTKEISSFACQPKMTYRLSITKDSSEPGSVTFNQSGAAGLRMKYNC